MGNLGSNLLPIVYNNTDRVDRDTEKKNPRYKSPNTWTQAGTLSDCFKIIIIILLLSSSILMYRSESPSTHRVNNKKNFYNTTQSKANNEADENSYGFHPFYHVHKRIQYTNPTINLCRDIDPSKTLLITILSRAGNVHIREAIRQSWGAIRIYNDIEIRVMFVVGVDDGVLKQIEIEQKIYHDVIQVNLPENYPFVSYKELAAICWSRYYCSNIQFLFKADEDIHLNTPLLTRIVAEFLKNETLSEIPIMYGWFRHKSRVDRNGRYLVTEEEYNGYYYPPYTFGIGYLMTKAGRDNLCLSAQEPHPVTRVGDAYITGILRNHAMVKHERLRDIHYIYSFTLNGKRCEEYFTYDPKLLICMSSLHSGTSDVADEYVHVWNILYKEDDNR